MRKLTELLQLLNPSYFVMMVMYIDSEIYGPCFVYYCIVLCVQGILVGLLLYVLLAVHLITVLANNQPDSQFFFLYLFIPVLYMF